MFKTKFGLFEPTVMLFGLTNSPATFQAFMDKIYHEIVSDGNATIYMDDIMLFTQTMKEHWALIYKVLDITKKHDLYFKLKKCKIAQTTVKYLGLIITEGHIGMNPEKVKAILEWPYPKGIKGVQSFLGFGNYYHRFIDSFADIARPLYNLTKIKNEWKWTKEEAAAWDKLKKAFTEAPLLITPDLEKPWRKEPDGSGYAIIRT